MTDTPSTTEQKLDLDCVVDDLRTTGFAYRRDFETSERTARAGRTFGILFVIALFSVFVPLLHFILPPLFLIAGFVFGFVAWLETAEVTRGEVSCPNCKKAIELTREAEEWPKILRCPGCSFTLTIRPR